MQRIIMFGTSALIAAASLMADDAPKFRINGSMAGILDGASVKLTSRQNGRNVNLAETQAKDGKFVLEGSVEMPSVCRIVITKAEGKRGDAGFELMVDNSPIEVSVCHIDSLPPSFYVGTIGKHREKHIKISGGRVQDEYNEFRNFMFPYELERAAAYYRSHWAPDIKTIDEAESKRREEAFHKAVIVETEAQNRFINEHPAYSISAEKWCGVLAAPFSFTDAELDDVWNKVKNCPDKQRVAQLESVIADAREVVKGAEYTDFEFVAPDGSKRLFSKEMVPGKYTMIDFWASWCGPCRASIPHVRGLYNDYKDKLEIMSISVDDEDSDWRGAMEQEKMDWKQFRSPKEMRDIVSNAYKCRGIPYMLILSPDGKIIYAGHNPGEVSALLAKELK